MKKHRLSLSVSIVLFLSLTALVPSAASAKPASPAAAPKLQRADFNRLARHANLPLFWVADSNGNQTPDAEELAAQGAGAPLRTFVAHGKLTERFHASYRHLVELRRQEAVTRELDAGRPTLIVNDLRKRSKAERSMIRELVAAAKLVDALYYRQTGAFRHLKALRTAPPASRALFARNSGPWCSAPTTSGDSFCNALPSFPTRISESYPSDATQDSAMCQSLRQHPRSKDLLDPFSVVRKQGGDFVALPLTKAFGAQMRQVARRLRAAARAIKALPKEAALHRYLLAAAQAFTDNRWEPADEAWAAMNSTNSGYYLRVGPDEVYVDPCQQKAGFHLSLALIDTRSLAWKKRLFPLRDTMERSLATLIGSRYRARRVAFDMPDFIQVVLNSGDSRHPLGATIGQSLPNWGKVATEGRRRTMVMSNLYTDPDSLRIKELKARALLTKDTLRFFTRRPEPGLLATILHEIGHNFGPDSGYLIGGKMPKEIFGGALASTLEELKAQTLALWYLELLVRRGIIKAREANEVYTDSVMWAFGHITRGMSGEGGQPKPYSRLAAVQMGWLMDHGALTYRQGRFTIQFNKMASAVEGLMRRVGQIKASGDARAARTLIDTYISDKALGKIHFARLKQLLLKYPKAAFDYSIVL